MTQEMIQKKTNELRAKTRRTLLRGMAVMLLVAGISGFGIARASSAWIQSAFVFAIVWSLVGQYFLNRGMWSPIPPEDAGVNTGLTTYRREVDRRRHIAGYFTLWLFGPLLLAMAALILLIVSFGTEGRGVALDETLRKMIPFLSLTFIWIVFVIALRVRDGRDLRREIARLNDLA